MTATERHIGAYRIVHKLGEGGMGSVWLAEHTMLGRRAAIKVLHPMFSQQQDIVTRFFNEARAATAISDPGIVQIFDFGHHTDGSAYIVMELLDGETLDARWRRLGTLALGDAMRIVRQVASSLGAAHTRGIVHRDLKPENIFLVRDPEVAGGERAKILDFGIAKLSGEGHQKTQTSVVMGTPTFMAPEQCRGAGHVDQRADIYSLGCVLFTIVIGRPPFEAEGAGELIAMHLREPAPRASTRAIGIPPAIDDLIARCLAKDARERFASGTELAAALGALVTDTGLRVTGTTTPTTLSGAAAQQVPTRRRIAFGSGIAVIAGTLGVWWLSTRRADTGEVHPIVIAPPPLPAPDAAPPPPAPAPVEASLRTALTAFATWAKNHAGAPCPSVVELDARTLDPWGHALVVTCTDQPADQVAGVISAGPDGQLGTSDDIASWTLGRDLTSIVHGARWVTAVHPRVHRVTDPTPASPPPIHPAVPPNNFDDQLKKARENTRREVKVEPVE